MKKLFLVLLAIVAIVGTHAENQKCQFPLHQQLSGIYVVDANSRVATPHTLSWQEDTIRLNYGDGRWLHTYHLRTYRESYGENEQPTWDYEVWRVRIPFRWHVELAGQSSSVVISHIYSDVEAQLIQQRYVTEKDTFTMIMHCDVDMAEIEREFKNMRLSVMMLTDTLHPCLSQDKNVAVIHLTN